MEGTANWANVNRPSVRYSAVSPSRQRVPRNSSNTGDDGAADDNVFYKSSWAGMGKRAVETRSGYIFWRVFRMAIMVGLVVCCLGMLVACIVILAQGDSVNRDGCPNRKVRPWFDTAIGYQVFPASYQDSDGDGVGDLKGIVSRLEYLEYLGVDSIWLSPVFKSSHLDLWTDVTDLTAVDGVYGKMEDFEELLATVHAKNMRLILEFIPSHTSDQHPWFQASRQSTDNEYSQYYIWVNGANERQPERPTEDLFRDFSWEYDSVRRQWYLYFSIKEKPVLNYRNLKVVRDIEAAIQFWVAKGVDGFYMRHVGRLMYEHNPATGGPGKTEHGGNLTSSETTQEVTNKTLDVIAGWRQILDDYQQTNGTQDNPRVLVVDTDGDLSLVTRLHSNTSLGTRPGDFPFNFMFLAMTAPLNGNVLRTTIEKWITSASVGTSRHWAIGTTDVSRVASRCGERLARALMFLMLMLPGTPLIYYGDEIGMKDVWNITGSGSSATNMLRSETHLSLSPMQWTPDIHSNFTGINSDPWLPVGINVSKINVELQRNDNHSTVVFIKQAIRFRKSNSHLFGIDSFRLQTSYNEILAFTMETSARNGKASSAVFGAINVARYGVVENYQNPNERIPSTGVVVLSTDHSRVQESIHFSKFLLGPGEAILVRYKPLPKPDF